MKLAAIKSPYPLHHHFHIRYVISKKSDFFLN